MQTHNLFAYRIDKARKNEWMKERPTECGKEGESGASKQVSKREND